MEGGGKEYPSEWQIPKGIYVHRDIFVPTDGHSPEWMAQFYGKLSGWVSFGFMEPNDYFTKEELDYIFNNMKPLSDILTYEPYAVLSDKLYRVEKINHFDDKNLKIGDKLNNVSEIRSFSRQHGMPNKLITDYRGKFDDGATIYVIDGDTRQFDVDRFIPNMGEFESFVDTSSLTVSNIKKFEGGDENMIQDILDNTNIDLFQNEGAEQYPTKVTVVYLKQDT